MYGVVRKDGLIGCAMRISNRRSQCAVIISSNRDGHIVPLVVLCDPNYIGNWHSIIVIRINDHNTNQLPLQSMYVWFPRLGGIDSYIAGESPQLALADTK